MLKIEIKNETSEGFDIETQIEGNERIILRQMISALDIMYEACPGMFEKALLLSKCAKDNT